MNFLLHLFCFCFASFCDTTYGGGGYPSYVNPYSSSYYNYPSYLSNTGYSRYNPYSSQYNPYRSQYEPYGSMNILGSQPSGGYQRQQNNALYGSTWDNYRAGENDRHQGNEESGGRRGFETSGGRQRYGSNNGRQDIDYNRGNNRGISSNDNRGYDRYVDYERNEGLGNRRDSYDYGRNPQHVNSGRREYDNYNSYNYETSRRNPSNYAPSDDDIRYWRGSDYNDYGTSRRNPSGYTRNHDRQYWRDSERDRNVYNREDNDYQDDEYGYSSRNYGNGDTVHRNNERNGHNEGNVYRNTGRNEFNEDPYRGNGRGDNHNVDDSSSFRDSPLGSIRGGQGGHGVIQGSYPGDTASYAIPDPRA